MSIILLNPYGVSGVGLGDVFGGLVSYLGNYAAEYRHPSFYSYTLDGSNKTIGDGGGDMYDVGNFTYPWYTANTPNYSTSSAGVEADALAYDTSGVVDGSFIYQGMGYGTTPVDYRPLTMFGYRNSVGEPIGFQKSGNSGSDGSGILDSGLLYSGTNINGFTVHAFRRQTYNASDPSHCDLYILLGHPQWESVFGTINSYADPVSNGGNGGFFYTSGASVKNILAVTTLLSKSGGALVTQDDCRFFINALINRIHTYVNFGYSQRAFVAPGTYNFIVPDDVTSISVVSVGGGAAAAITGSGSGSNPRSVGGGGGALAWKNNIAVTPGQTVTVNVGIGGTSDGQNGGNSSIVIGGITYAGAGGGFTAAPGTYTDNTQPTALRGTRFGNFDGGGEGGAPGVGNSAVGGGGAGGYSGNGGSQTGGAGGNGAGDGINASGGGGVGIFGQGTSGLNATLITVGGGSGSGGQAGFPASLSVSGRGGLYGGGGGQDDQGSKTTPITGGHGAVRIIWGAGRAFPSTNTTDQ